MPVPIGVSEPQVVKYRIAVALKLIKRRSEVFCKTVLRFHYPVDLVF